MKKCPFCAEEIQDEAIKCKHCGEFLDKTPPKAKEPWFYNDYLLLLMFLCILGFAIPFVWLNPKYSKTKKIILTLVMAVVTILAVWVSMYSWNNSIKPYMGQMNDAFKMLDGK